MTLATSASKSTSASRMCGAWRFKCATTCASVFLFHMLTSETAIVIVLGLSDAEAAPSAANSTSCYDLVEDIRIVPIVETKSELVQVQRGAFL